jgi:hypothetical protein
MLKTWKKVNISVGGVADRKVHSNMHVGGVADGKVYSNMHVNVGQTTTSIIYLPVYIYS